MFEKQRCLVKRAKDLDENCFDRLHQNLLIDTLLKRSNEGSRLGLIL
jgi:hypothetical protein